MWSLSLFIFLLFSNNLQDSKSVVSNELSDGFRGFGNPEDDFTSDDIQQNGGNYLLSPKLKEKNSKTPKNWFKIQLKGTSSSILNSEKASKVTKSLSSSNLHKTPQSKISSIDVFDNTDEAPVQSPSSNTSASSKAKKITKPSKNSQTPSKTTSEETTTENIKKSKKQCLPESSISKKSDKTKLPSKSNTPLNDSNAGKSKGLLRPSKLDAVTDTPSPVVGSFSTFGQHQNERKGKRKWKPSLKMQQHVVALSEQKRTSLGSPSNASTPKFGQATFGSQLSLPKSTISGEFLASDILKKQKDTTDNEEDSTNLDQEVDVMECNDASDSPKESKWGSSRLRKVENKFVKTGNRIGASPVISLKECKEANNVDGTVRGKHGSANSSINTSLKVKSGVETNADIENQEPSDNGRRKSQTLEKSQKQIIRKSKLNHHNNEINNHQPAENGKQPLVKSTPLIRESRLKLNDEVLEQLKFPSHQVEFYQAIQRSMQSSERKPPNLIDSMQNPAGTALVSSHEDGDQISNQTSANAIHSKHSKASPTKASNRMPGHIVCGICGAVRYYSFILQAKKFGTFSCEPCRKFISKCIKTSSSTKDGTELFSCVMKDKTSNKGSSTKIISEPGMCVVPPVIRKNPSNPQASTKSMDHTVDSSGNALRCQACWLKLCLIGYNLDSALYDKLRLHLSPKNIFQKQLPISSDREKSSSLLPHRGKILEFNRQVPLSKPLFDGFGEQNCLSDDYQKGSKKLSIPDINSSNDAFDSNLSSPDIQSDEIPKKRRKFGNSNDKPHCIERLPNGWTKKAMKHVSGNQ